MNRGVSNVLLSVTIMIWDASGCGPSLNKADLRLQTDDTWKGKSIHIDADMTLQTVSSSRKFEVRYGDHEIIIEEDSISLDGATSALGDFSKVDIKKEAEDVEIWVDAKKLFIP